MRVPIGWSIRYCSYLFLGVLSVLSGGCGGGSGFASSSNNAAQSVDPDPGVTRALTSWTKLPDPYNSGYTRAVLHIGVAPNGYVYVTGTGGVAYSTTGGQSWKLINTGLPAGLIQSIGFNSLSEPVISVNSQNIISAYRYTLGSWHKANGISASLQISAFTLDSTGALIAVTGWNGDVFRSTDNGSNYVRVATTVGAAVPGNSVGALWSVLKAPDGSLYTGGEVPSIYRSTNNGTTWVLDGLSKSQGYGGNMAALGCNALNEILAGRTVNITGSVVQRRVNGVWTSSSVGLPLWSKVRGLATTSSTHVVYVSVVTTDTTGGVYRSTDNGKTWQNFNAGLPTTSASAPATDKMDAVYVASVPTGILYKH